MVLGNTVDFKIKIDEKINPENIIYNDLFPETKIKYGDSNNSEYTMPFEKNFDKIFLEALRENRDKKLNSIL